MASHVDVLLSSSVETLQTSFSCPICLEMFKDPVRTTSCGHTFCKMCIKMVLQKLSKEPCPICKTLLSNRDIVEDEKMSVFLGLVIELITSINTDLRFDVTAYFAKPISSYESSLNSEEFLNMKSNTVACNEQLTCAKKTISSNQDDDSMTRKSHRSVSVQTSPIKCKLIPMRLIPIRREKSTETKEKNDDSVNVGENVVKSDCLESQKLLLPRNAPIFCDKGIENDRVMNEPSNTSNQETECPKNNVSQEDMDIFEPPEAELHTTKKRKMNSIQKVVELNDDNSDLTQKYIQSLRDMNAKLSARVTTLESKSNSKDLKTLQDNFDRFSVKIDGRFSDIKSKITEIQGKCTRLENNTAHLESTVNNMRLSYSTEPSTATTILGASGFRRNSPSSN